MSVHLVVTPGDPRGIGPEVAEQAVQRFRAAHPAVDLSLFGPEGPSGPEGFAPLVDAAAARHDDDAWGGEVAAASIERAVAAAGQGSVHAIVTAPLHKPSLHASGRRFPGQTEMLAALSATPTVGMLMAAERTRLDAPLRVLLATTHVALRDVPTALTSTLLVEQAALLHRALHHDWGMGQPRIGICALNPHASDGGLFGDEEETVYAPALETLAAMGIPAVGPVPADTVYTRAMSGEFDAVVAPYHDVGMAAFKTVSFGTGVNVTLGLPFIRTSPDHGTAFDIAGSGRANPASMLEALELAWRLAKTRFDTPSTDV